MTVTQDETIERGLAAASLLSDPTFQSVLKSCVIECFSTFTESKPNETSKREDSYNLYQGLQAIEAELAHRVQLKDKAVSMIDATNTDEDFLIYTQGNTDQ